uniref:Large ribosomal subunit protein bL35m n=1 Tax=Lygus hesperus TaxID=30085 RepID=A0A0A9XSC7_LYGHE
MMFRTLLNSCGRLGVSLSRCVQPPLTRGLLLSQPVPCPLGSNVLKTLRAFSVLNTSSPAMETRFLLAPKTADQHSTRSLTKYSLQKGKRKCVKAVIRRFFRLDWGIWIRPKCGRHKKIYTKSWRRRRRLRQHVFTNATQSWLLDTMVTRYWSGPSSIPTTLIIRTTRGKSFQRPEGPLKFQ